MKLILLSNPEPVANEIRLITELFGNGLEIFHAHKPGLPEKEIQDYIGCFPHIYRSRIFRHGDFPKFHSLEELENYTGEYDYAFLSPVFDSISKKGYKSPFNLDEVQAFLKRKILSPLSGEGQGGVIALGGIDEDKIETIRGLGFAGAAVLGAVWRSKNPVEKFKRLKALCQNKDLVY